MRESFRGYYPPSETEVRDMWARGLVILDTNALLNLFRYTETTRIDFLKVLDAKAAQLWIPYQVGLEFHRRRIEVINAQERAFSDLETTLTSAKNTVQNTVNRFKRHPSLDTARLSDLLDRSIADLSASVEEAQERHRNTVLAHNHNRQTLESITALYEGKVGSPWTADELGAIYARGADRYDKQIPPGYKDKDKSEPSRYGDLVLWEEILRKGRETKLPALFITDDAKEDWWYIVDGDTQGPRVELIDEYWEAAGARIHFYTPDRFADMFAQASGPSTISPESVAEVQKVSNARPRRTTDDEVLSLRELEAQRVHLWHSLSSRKRPTDRTLLMPTRGMIRDELSQLSDHIDLARSKLTKLENAMQRFEGRLAGIKDEDDVAVLIPERDSMHEERSRLLDELDRLLIRQEALRKEYSRAPEEEIYDDSDYREVERRLMQIERAIRKTQQRLEAEDE